MSDNIQSITDDFNDDTTLVTALRNGEQAAFEALVARYHTPLLRLAMVYTSDPRLAEEAVQETWIAALRGIARFEGRSSLKTWLFSILMNRAKTIAAREGRYTPLPDRDDSEPFVSQDRFHSADDPDNADAWISIPSDWGSVPEQRMITKETLDIIQQTIAALPPNQREVITLRDIEMWTAEEVRNLLNITDANQRVLLHRARSKVRQVLEDYFAEAV